MIRVLSLFAGIGGADLGLERAGGFKTVAMCENNPDRRADLARLFPDARIYDDVVTLGAERLSADGIFPDFICGGFPCQQISVAGKGEGIGTEENPTDRSGLWFQFARLIRDTEPSWVVIENSPRLRRLGLETILRFLYSCGYDAFWDGIPASAVGAYHQRDRLFVIAHRYSDDGGQGRTWRLDTGDTREHKPLGAFSVANSDDMRKLQSQGSVSNLWRRLDDGNKQPIAHGHGTRLAFWESFRGHLGAELATIKRDNLWNGAQRISEPGMVGTVYDVPATLDRSGKISKDDRAIWKSRIQALGNSVIPGIFEAIGRAIMHVDGRYSA